MSLSLERCTGVSKVSLEVLGPAVARLGTVSLSNTDLSTAQVTSLLQHAAASKTLTKLDLRGVCLKQVSEKLVAGAKNYLLKDDIVVEQTLETPYIFLLSVFYIGVVSILFYCIYTYL